MVADDDRGLLLWLPVGADFAECVDVPGFWTAAEAAAIRAEGLRVVAALEAGRFPFDGSWCDFRPDPA